MGMANRLDQVQSCFPFPSALMDSFCRDAELLGGCLHSQSLPVYCENNRISFVVGLFRDSGPSAVFTAIATRIINAVYRVISSRSFSHIFKEGLKRRKCTATVKPVITDRYASTSVIGVAGVIRVRASLRHSVPRNVFRGSLSFSGISMRKPIPVLLASAAT